MVVLLLLILLYGIVSLMVSIHLRMEKSKNSFRKNTEGITVIIPFRNEETRIQSTIASLNKLRFPDCSVEVLFIDDHSTDNSEKLIRDELSISVPYSIIQCKPHSVQTGKAAALMTGISMSATEWIVITDADMHLHPEWLVAMHEQMTVGLDMICCPSLVKPTGFLKEYQATETRLLMAIAAGLHQSGFPVSAIGNNMAFRKDKYVQSGGLEGMKKTVREDFDLYHLFVKNGFTIHWEISPPLTAETQPVQSLKEWFSQKKRWFGLPVEIPSQTVALIAVFWIYLLAMLITLVTWNWWGWILLFTGKWLLDWLMLSAFRRQSGHKTTLISLLQFELVYSFLLFLLPLSALFYPAVQWKDRKI